MDYSIDHDRFVAKNKSLARWEEIVAKDKTLEKKGYDFQQRQKEASCFNCRMKQKCPQFRTKRNGGTSGVVSIGGGETLLCSRYTPAPTESRIMSDKQVKSLLKNTMRGLR